MHGLCAGLVMDGKIEIGVVTVEWFCTVQAHAPALPGKREGIFTKVNKSTSNGRSLPKCFIYKAHPHEFAVHTRADLTATFFSQLDAT